VRPKIARLA